MSPEANEPRSISEEEWTLLLQRIRDGMVTPFLGAGACFGTLPLGSELAEAWADEYGYPFEDRKNLAHVAQFVARRHDDWMLPKRLICSDFAVRVPPDFSREDEPHGVLAELPLPVYITTNYDHYMSDALRSRGKDARRDFCRWNRAPAVEGEPRPFDSAAVPTPAVPVVFHLHGHLGVPESMVLTDEDYVDFLAATQRATLLPPRIQEALVSTSLLFIGYALEDFTVRVLLRGLDRSGVDPTFTVPRVDPNWPSKVVAYLGDDSSRWPPVIWGTAADFATELRSRWRESERSGPGRS